MKHLILYKKFAILLFLMGCAICTNAQSADSATAEELFAQACQKAKAENKNVLVIFKASWCGWCHKMEKAINDVNCKELFDKNYVMLYLDVYEKQDAKHLETPGAEAMNVRYLGMKQGLPFWLFFNADGQLLSDSMIRNKGQLDSEAGQNIGCPASDDEVELFTKLLKKTSGLTDLELHIISERFKRNARNK